MYLPRHFEETRPDILHALMRARPLATLVTSDGAGGFDANHIPLHLDPAAGPHGVLRGHVARANPLWRQPGDGAEVLVVFRGAQGYVSPGWYPGKHETHRHVPTWNYEVVHAHGRLRVRDDAAFVRGVVARLTRAHEAGEPTPWKMGDAPADYLAAELAQVVGIEIELTRLQGKRKLSQNRDARDFDGVVRALDERGRAELAAAMRRAAE